MFVTARQLEELHRSGGGNGHVTLPYRARLSPLAQDWIRQKRIQVGYGEVELQRTVEGAAIKGVGADTDRPRSLLWWADSPCGPAKAALLSAVRDGATHATEIAVDSRRIVEAIKLIAREINAGRASAAVLLVGSGATAMVYANRCPSLRAVLGTCLDSVEQASKLLAANVLVIEHPYKSLTEARAIVSKFLKSPSAGPPVEVKRQLQELSTCA